MSLNIFIWAIALACHAACKDFGGLFAGKCPFTSKACLYQEPLQYALSWESAKEVSLLGS